MSRRINQILFKSVIGSALVISLSACTITPVNPDSRVGQATEKLTAAGSSFLERAKHVLRLDGTDAYNGRPAVASTETGDEFQNEVDLALLQEGHQNQNAVIGADGELVVLSPVADNDGIINTTPQSSEVIVSDNVVTDPLLAPENTTEQTVTAQAPVQQPAVVVQETPMLQDYVHQVADNETLWDLSKKLTGDATNWKVLAELNNLGPNGAVFPGNKLVIPADMLKDPSQAMTQMASLDEQTAETTENLQMASGERIKIPENEAVAVVTDIVTKEPSVPAFDGPTTGFEVQASETMWDLAKRTTGDATNWKQIAAANGMTEKEATFIKYGQTIDVPNELLKAADSLTLADKTEQSASDAPVLAAAQGATQGTTQGNDAQATQPVIDVTVAASNESQPVTEEELTIIPTTFKSEPLVVDQDNTAGASDAGEKQIILVSGTYYPKAIYNDANFSASLLMRVSPGTQLEVIRTLGPWYEVRTDQGVGFVHSRDIK